MLVQFHTKSLSSILMVAAIHINSDSLENAIGGTRSTYGTEKKCIQYSGWKT
jgi:hypothetical protein